MTGQPGPEGFSGEAPTTPLGPAGLARARLVAGLAGHVDHGKTALVRALTGMETDRLPEEKRRGLSIALGFAHLALPGGGTADLIDMPGHERFVRTMIAGATGLDAVLLCVSAAEGVKPQTREHAGIAALLGIGAALVVVTKTDLADAGQGHAVGEAAAALLREAGIGVTGIVYTSAATGAGLDALRQGLALLLARIAAPAEDGFPYLPVDRAFSVPGHGTVVTGTLRRGSLAAGAVLQVLPGGAEMRLRGLQVHGKPVAEAHPGQRVAANLRGVAPAALPHGAALCEPGLLAEAEWLTLRLRALPDGPALRNGQVLRLLFGTAEAEARLRLLEGDSLAPGETAFAQLRCPPGVMLPVRERVVLRQASPAGSVAGGVVLETGGPRLRRHAPEVVQRLAALAAASPAEAIGMALSRAGGRGATPLALARLAGVSRARAVAAAQESGMVFPKQGLAVAEAAFAALCRALPGRLGAFPEGASAAELAAALPGSAPALVEAAAARLLAAGLLVQADGRLRVRRPEQERARGQAEAAGVARLVSALQAGGLSPPDAARLAPDVQARRLLARLVRDGTVIEAVDKVQKRSLYFHRDAVAAARRLLQPALAGDGLLVSEAGALLGVTRKYSVPLLEYFAATRVTRRVADRHVLAPPAASEEAT